MTQTGTKTATATGKEAKGWAYCPICTHTVDAQVLITGKKVRVKPNQKCPRCNSTLDAGYVVQFDLAA